MKRVCSVPVLLALLLVAAAETDRTGPPSVDTIVRLARESRMKKEEYVKDYTCLCVEEIRFLDKKGETEETVRMEKRVYMKGKIVHEEVVSIQKDGQPLSDEEVKKAQEEIHKREKERAEDKESAPIPPFGEEGKGKYEFQWVREDSVDGRSAYILSVKPKEKSGRLFRGLCWVDKETFSLLKSEGSPAKNPSRIKEMEVSMEYMEVENEIFLIKSMRVKARARFLLFIKRNIEMERTCGNYRLNVGLEDRIFPELQVE